MREILDATPRVDVRGLGLASAVILVVKSVRFLSRGTTVLIDVDGAIVAAELAAWAAWIGHEVDLPRAAEAGTPEHCEVTLIVRAPKAAQA